MSDNAAEANPTRASGGFFAIDRCAFRCAAVGDLNAAVAHLVMARGTGPITAQRNGACIQSNSARASRGRTRPRSAIIQSDNGGDE
jgi:hypothetical protein